MNTAFVVALVAAIYADVLGRIVKAKQKPRPATPP
jgi:hypothetical protein